MKFTSISPLAKSIRVVVPPFFAKDGSQLGVSIIVRKDDEIFKSSGRVTSGKHNKPYLLEYTLPWGFFGRQVEPSKLAQTYRLGELSKRFDIGIKLEGDCQFKSKGSILYEKPLWMPYHNSIAFDAATSAREDGGDGIVSLTHTASGSNRVALMTVGVDNPFSSAAGTMDYGGVSGETLIVLNDGTFTQQATYYVIAPPTSAQTVTNTQTDTTPDADNLTVMSLTGVDQTTPVPAADVKSRNGTSETGPSSLTVTNVASTDLVCDHWYNQGVGSATIGADQTERASVGNGSNPDVMKTSTQDGSNGGVMSWSWTGSVHDVHTAYRVVAAGGGGGFTALNRMTLGPRVGSRSA
jgi:hypothetical protein